MENNEMIYRRNSGEIVKKYKNLSIVRTGFYLYLMDNGICIFESGSEKDILIYLIGYDKAMESK